MTRELKLELVTPRQVMHLVTIDMDAEVNETEVFAGIRDNIAKNDGDYVGKPDAMSYFRATDLSTDKRYDMAMLFTSDYLEVASPMQLQTDYQHITSAITRLVAKLNEGGFE